MHPVLQIAIGTPSFTDKKISKDTMEKTFSNVLDTLGIEVAVDIVLTGNNDFLTVNGYTCGFPASLIREVNTYVLFLEQSKDKASAEDLFWELILSQIIWMQPHAFFPVECLPGYMPSLDSLPQDDHNEIQKNCKEIIDELLNQKISLANKPVIAEISDKYLKSTGIEWNNLREELISSLINQEITVFFNEDYFDQIKGESRENLFELMRDGLFYENGIKYPPFKISFDNDLPHNAFYFKINSFTSIPLRGLDHAGELLVNDTPDRLKLIDITGQEAVNPANGNSAAIINSAEKEKAENFGLTTWNSLGYFVLCFSGFLRKYGYICIDQKMTSQYLKTLKLISPKIIELVEKSNPVSLYAKIFRLLAKEEISIRNLRVILEAILESDYIVADGHKHIIFDERIPVRPEQTFDWKTKAENITEFVRTRLKKYISHKYTKGQSALIVYLLDPEIEKIVDPVLNPPQTILNETLKKICDAVYNEIGNLPPSSQAPVILTTVTVRPFIKRVIESRFPQVAVLSYQELSPEMNIQPVARISLS